MTTVLPTSSMFPGPASSFGGSAYESIGGYTPDQGRRHRLGGGDHGPHEGMADQDLHGEDPPPSSDHGHRERPARSEARYSLGRQDYYLGNHPLWQLFRMFYQMKYKPYVVGGLALFWGYAVAGLQRRKKTGAARAGDVHPA